MKKYLILIFVVAITLISVPLCVFYLNGDEADISENITAEAVTSEKSETVAVYLTDKKTVSDIPMRDYIICCVAAEMPAAYEQEALAAQAIASLTLARYMKENNTENNELEGAVISTDSKKYQGYMSVEEMKSRWGEDFDFYYSKLCKAVDEVLDYTVTYDGETAMTAFHAISTGLTETAENVWDKKIPYLVNVNSEWDEEAAKYSVKTEFGKDDIIKKLSLGELSENPDEWVSGENYTRAGTLKSINIGGKTFTGEELRSLLELRSPSVTVSVENDTFVFETKGYGHGVGMSQNGANCLAKKGCTWEEIIEHYYPGTDITKAENQ